MGRSVLLSVVGLLCLFSDAIRGEFIPGHIFVSEFAYELCTQDFDRYPGDRIWEIDPETGEVSLFAHLRDEWCGGASGIIFTPDGTRLRVAQWDKSRIIELDANANPTVLYDNPNHGVNAPIYSCMAFDQKGNFYVSVFRKILRFPVDSDQPEVFASYPTDPLVGDSGPITVDSNGDLYYGRPPGGGALPKLVRFTGPHAGSLFAEFPSSVWGLQSNSCGEIYVGVEQGGTLAVPQLLQYYSGDPQSLVVLAEGSELLGHVPYLALDPTQIFLYVSSSNTRISRFSLVDGTMVPLAEITTTGNAGIAVVPVQNPPYGFTPCRPPIPTVSFWGLLILSLSLLIVGKVYYGERADYSIET